MISTGVHNPVALLFEFPECFDIFRNPHDGGLKRLQVDVGECVSPVFVVRKLVTNRADTLFDDALVFGDLGEAIQGVVVELATGIAVVVQRFTLAFGRFEAIPVVVVHARWSSTYSFNTYSETCPVEMRQYELFQKESPQVGFNFVFVLVMDASSSCTLDSVDKLHEVCGRLSPEQDVNVVVFVVEIGQYA